MTTMQISRDLWLGLMPTVSVEANLRQQVKHSGRSQNRRLETKEIASMTMMQISRDLWLGLMLTVSVEANLHQQVKHSGRNQNRRLEKGLPA